MDFTYRRFKHAYEIFFKTREQYQNIPIQYVSVAKQYLNANRIIATYPHYLKDVCKLENIAHDQNEKFLEFFEKAVFSYLSYFCENCDTLVREIKEKRDREQRAREELEDLISSESHDILNEPL